MKEMYTLTLTLDEYVILMATLEKEQRRLCENKVGPTIIALNAIIDHLRAQRKWYNRREALDFYEQV